MFNGRSTERSVDVGHSDAVGCAVAVVWAASAWFSGGFGEGAVAVVGITLTALFAVGLSRGRDVLVAPRGPRLVAALAVVAFLLWTCASIAWAGVRETAIVGAEKTYVYAIGFLVLLLIRAPTRTVVRIVGAYVASLGVVAAAVATETVARPTSAFLDGRLQAPAGYINASVALWMLGFWPACQLAASEKHRPAARVGAAAAATTFLGLAVLGQSRAWLFVSVAVAVVFVLVTPIRGRVSLALAISVIPVAGAWHWLTHVFAAADGGMVTRSSAATAVASLAVATFVAAGLAYAWTRLERRGAPSATVRRGLHALAVAAAIAASAIGAARFGGVALHPVRWGEGQWRTFAQVELSPGGRTRFLAPLGSDRYPEWVIAWNAFKSHPLQGIGSENYADVYLLHRRDSLHEPSFPHSIPLGLLSQLGLVGVALLSAGAVAAVAAAVRGRRGDGGIAAAASMAPLYWLAHGSFDWFWEFPALAGPALGFLALAAAAPTPAPARGSPSRGFVRVAVSAGAVAALLAVAALTATAVAAAYTSSAERLWRTDPNAAYRRLHTAARLDPFSAAAPLLSGSIALELDDYGRARSALREATARDPRDWYVWLQLALVDSETHVWPRAQREVAKALRLDPRDPVVQLVNFLIRKRRHVFPNDVNRLYANVSRHRLGGA